MVKTRSLKHPFIQIGIFGLVAATLAGLVFFLLAPNSIRMEPKRSEFEGMSRFSDYETKGSGGVIDMVEQARAGKTAEEIGNIRILFGGDMMFDRYIRTQSEKMGKREVLLGVSKELLSADVVVANLEGPMTSNPSKSAGSSVGEARNFLFTFDPEWANVLFDMNIRIVNIGNNHILNFGEAGLIETRKFLRAAKVKFFGDPLDESLRAYVAEIKGKKIGFVNYNQFYLDAENRTLSDIARLRPLVDVLFVYTHWGAEYVPATSEEKRLARLFIDRGADAVIGSHPHVVQEKEIYHEKTIYYSLGNFVFDQYFSPETKHGLVVDVAIASDNTLSFREIPVELFPDGRTEMGK